jgi:hypothetical protein
MNILDEFVARALVGSQRQAGPLPLLPEDFAGLSDPAAPFEKALLDAAAACTIYSTCGVTTTPSVDRSPACPPDEMAECSPTATQVLVQLLASNLDSVLFEWLQAAANASRRPPHSLLPALLDRAAARRDLRDVVHRVIDNRGTWLAGLNPQWQFAKTTPTDLETAWQTGARDERLGALRTIRESDPACGRQLVQDTWSADPADDRVRWLGALANNLSMDDEPFLESCLDDRSSRVRETAADLLARLPTSRLVARMTGRVQKLFAFTPGQPRSVRKLQAKQPPTLTVVLPESFDKAMLRDGMIEKPAEKVGQKQWWLTQMVAAVPPAYWSNRFETSAADLVAALELDYADAVVTGWRTAASRHADPSWATALANSPAGQNRWSGTYLAGIPEADRPTVLANTPTSDQVAFDLGSLLSVWSPAGAAVSRAVVARFTPEQLLAAGAATRLHPDVLADLEPGLTELSTKPYVGRQADEALTAIHLRRAIHSEFAS